MMGLKVPYLNYLACNTDLKEISREMDKLNHHAINQAPWSGYPYKPKVLFTIAYTRDAILLKYFVQEKSIHVSCYTTNSPVHRDSCVEFFISFNDETSYYNLEFNCIGTCYAAFGSSRNDRQLLPAALLAKIRRLAEVESMEDAIKKYVQWQLTLVVPLEIFRHHELEQLKNRNCNVNFYKCGDALPEPHFLSWNKITADAPDFHLPAYFGQMEFV